ncbi:MAG TPA: rhomboid family intramembrane serine protease [Gammaproteobacteria bacterium]|nr:rhomboid family intramembrane serine protease [Gammaproteobacteria bacterium]
MIPIHDDNPTRTPPYVTTTILVLCVLVFLWQLSLGRNVELAVYQLGMIPATVFGHKMLPAEIALVPPWMTLFTSMFMHGGWMHLIGNMLYLWIFGDNVEDSMGHGRFLIFYLLCGIAAALAQALPNPDSEVPMIGASGAISGVLGAYVMLYPHARVLVVIPIGFIIQTFSVPAGFVLGFWFLMQLLSSLAASGQQGGVAFGAHIGGFLAGLALIPLFKYRDVPLFAPPRPYEER